MESVLTAPAQAAGRKAGIPQGATIVLAGFLPILAIVTLTVAVPSIIGHFEHVENARLLGPVLVSAPGLTIAIFAPLMGYFVDRFGRRPMMVWATLLYGASGVAPFFLNDLYQIIGSRLVLGVAEAAILTIINTLIADYWDEKGRRTWLTAQGVIGPVLAAIVIAASGYLTEFRWNGVFLVYAIAFPLFVAMLAFLFEPTRQMAVHSEKEAGDKLNLPLAATVFLVTLALSSLYYVWIIQGGRAFNEVGVSDPSDLGLLFSAVSLGVPVGAIFFGLLSSRLMPPLQLLITFSLLGVGLAIIGAAQSPQLMVGGLIIQQFAAGMSVPTLLLWVQGLFPYAVRGRAVGLWSSAFFLGQFSSPFMVDFARGVAGSVKGAFFAAGVAGVAIAAGIFVFYIVHSKQPKLFKEASQ